MICAGTSSRGYRNPKDSLTPSHSHHHLKYFSQRHDTSQANPDIVVWSLEDTELAARRQMRIAIVIAKSTCDATD